MQFIIYFFTFLIIVIAVIAYGNDFSLAFRSSKVRRIARHFNLNFERGDPNANLIENKTITFNTINGVINDVPVNFYDVKSPFSTSTVINEEIKRTHNESSQAVEKIAPVALTVGVGVLPYFYRSGMERISFLRIGNTSKYIGYRTGTMDIANRSNLYASKKLIMQIFQEVQQTGKSTTFDSLKSADKNSFQLLRSLYVREAS